MRTILRLHPTDNIIAALRDLPAGTEIPVDGQTVTLLQPIPAKHKFAVADLHPGDKVTMYGVLVGKASAFIPAGTRITTENLHHAAGEYSLEDRDPPVWTPPNTDRFTGRTWMGYARKDGRAGTANIWLVIPLVFCENKNIELLRRTFDHQLGFTSGKEATLDLAEMVLAYKNGATPEELTNVSVGYADGNTVRNPLFPNVDAVKYLTHQSGCGNSKSDVQALLNLLAGYITHPNVAGATVIGLGCQFAQEPMLLSAIHHIDPTFDKPLYISEQQAAGSERDFLSAAARDTFVGLARANRHERTEQPISKLTLGLECGGSDGFSGISANPTVGYVSDLLVALGARTILAEFPELNGVEQELVNRCATREKAEKFVGLMRAYAASAAAVGSDFADNPSPGNIRDGLITDAIKSAGAARKGGTSTINDVLDYGEVATVPGLNLLNTPGNDVESTTALAGSGCNLIVFTTGLGTPTGNPITPVVKLSSNTEMARRMSDIIDFECGSIIRGEDTVQSKGEELLEFLLEVASGTKTAAAVRRGQDDFIPWRRGVSL